MPFSLATLLIIILSPTVLGINILILEDTRDQPNAKKIVIELLLITRNSLF